MNNNPPDKQSTDSPAENFWRSSGEFYSDPQVSNHLLALQDQQSKNINQLLFALWVSSYYNIELDNSFTQKSTVDEERAKSWADNIRNLRFDIGLDSHADGSEEYSQLKDIILKTELKIEQIHQQRLVTGLLNWIEENNKACPSSRDKNELVQYNLGALCGAPADPLDFELLTELWLHYWQNRQNQ
ncbi:DUF2390 domain-containing protein [Aliikangiella maris]|uniref:DUF2390 domain-containing protein n=2 Tax=Aliikangiella maris TaxID=3162458 RepID=A0ABV3MNG8_9GAMM